ncbi:MAG TPA: hypothetical protein VEV61_06020 [Streptosporangiaceae bacterium]|nr:hypothetical protein [Streptosporangiaceae bacterium]
MNRLATRVGGAVAAAGLAVAVISATATVAAASGSPVPFQDSSVDGWLTFCNHSNQAVTSGSLDTQPFAWKLISSNPAPAGYRNSKSRATLFAYQPIKYVDPGDWSGSQLTAATIYSNPDHPVVQATYGDLPLLGFTQAYPPHWDGLVEIRMMWSGVGEPQLTTPYAAAVIRVSGSKWTLVKGGNASCSLGKGISVETILLPKKDYASPSPGGSRSAPSGGGSASPGGSAGGGPAGGSAASLAADKSAGGLSAGALVGIGLAVIALVWGGIYLLGWWRRRTAGAS